MEIHGEFYDAQSADVTHIYVHLMALEHWLAKFYYVQMRWLRRGHH